MTLLLIVSLIWAFSFGLIKGLGGFDPTGGFIYMWHSHNEREIVNNNVFVGGMFTMLLIQIRNRNLTARL